MHKRSNQGLWEIWCKSTEEKCLQKLFSWCILTWRNNRWVIQISTSSTTNRFFWKNFSQILILLDNRHWLFLQKMIQNHVKLKMGSTWVEWRLPWIQNPSKRKKVSVSDCFINNINSLYNSTVFKLPMLSTVQKAFRRCSQSLNNPQSYSNISIWNWRIRAWKISQWPSQRASNLLQRLTGITEEFSSTVLKVTNHLLGIQ